MFTIIELQKIAGDAHQQSDEYTRRCHRQQDQFNWHLAEWQAEQALQWAIIANKAEKACRSIGNPEHAKDTSPSSSMANSSE